MIDGELSGGGNAAVIVETAQAAVEPHTLAPDYHAIAVPQGGDVRTFDLHDALEARRAAPERKRGTVALTTVDEFAKFVDVHYDPDRTTVWVAEANKQVSAVLNDATRDEPAWRDHRAVVALRFSDPWKHWVDNDGHLRDQEAFAEHIEDGLAEVVKPDGADLLEIAQSFHATSEATFRSARRLSSGQVKLVYDEEVTASGGANGDMAIPDTFELAIAPFVGEEPLALTARLKYRLNAGKLKIGYRLIRPDDVVRFSLDVIAQRLRERFARVYLGDPR